MSTGRKGNWDKTPSPESDIQKIPERTGAADMPACPGENTLPTESTAPQFPYRALVVDDNSTIREIIGESLESDGHEVFAVADGLDGLHALGKSLPDVVISCLIMPRMSGFEFLAIVRKRFPHIATIAMSTEYIGETLSANLADAFLEKEENDFLEKLSDRVTRLLAASPIRSEREKSAVAPLFVPRDKAGYLIVTCPKCLRPSKIEAMSLDGGIHETLCPSCRTPVKFSINHEVGSFITHKDVKRRDT